ncbi:MAG: hypothetical protein IPH44_25095 [Myxococcales bacterium]|nr:hypothetical protein [Myxococcales bacterium]
MLARASSALLDSNLVRGGQVAGGHRRLALLEQDLGLGLARALGAGRARKDRDDRNDAQPPRGA